MWRFCRKPAKVVVGGKVRVLIVRLRNGTPDTAKCVGKPILVHQHFNSVKDTWNAVWAIYFHTRSTDNEPLHSFCPAGETPWCKYSQAVSKGTAKIFRQKNSLPPAAMDAIKPIFNSLSHPELLNRCLLAYTQNTNESLNSVIWQICPKISGSGRRIAEIAVYESVVRFNEGRLGRLNIMKELELCISNNAISSHNKGDI
ncbi:hypothetical protein AVEN_107728-1 [Araneus ventricosus]|uniref:Uncharacterized protein n=1 Tax=Araneus ventricosus TaxID=182803 RepID=A0A4Y2SWZ6_ARAVE|nr:hypothetical protein AVEN_107728-1 [Araneus ventricosus]